jgi:hypothetical protein
MSDCNVCLGTDDFESCDFYEAKIHVARKAYRCEECQEEIKPGQRYERVSAKYDGEFDCLKTCLICCELRTAFTCEPGYAICHGMLWEEIKEYLFPQMTTGCLQKVRTAEAKEFLIKRWNEWKFSKASR